MDDWEKPTVIRKSRPSGKDARSSTAVNQALASGTASIQKKSIIFLDLSMTSVVSAGGNKQHAGSAVNLSKLEQETEELKGIDPQQFIDVNPIVRTVDTSVSKAIASGRQQKGLTQKELATLINEKIQVVQEYEHGKALPNQQILGKLERALGVKLRGDNVGKPLEAGKKS